MFGKNKHEADTALEFWVPPYLAEQYPDALEDVRGRVTALTDRSWFENLSGGILAGHIGNALAAIEYGGIRPGSIRRPGQTTTLRPAKLARGGESEVFLVEEPTTPGMMSEAQEEHWAAYQYSERNAEQFQERRDALTSAALADPAKAWELHVHISALELAHERLQAAREKEKMERRRRDVELCPVCQKDDRPTIGAVKMRALLQGESYGYLRGISMLRSCLVCWEIAHTVHINTLSDEVCDDGRTRAESVLKAVHEAHLAMGSDS